MLTREVLIFDDKDGLTAEIWHKALKDASLEAGWNPTIHNQSQSAFEAMRGLEIGQDIVGAVVSVLGANSTNFTARMEGGFEGKQILRRADELEIPKALFSGHPDALDLISPTEVDLVLYAGDPPNVVGAALGSWLIGLA